MSSSSASVVEAAIASAASSEKLSGFDGKTERAYSASRASGVRKLSETAMMDCREMGVELAILGWASAWMCGVLICKRAPALPRCSSARAIRRGGTLLGVLVQIMTEQYQCQRKATNGLNQCLHGLWCRLNHLWCEHAKHVKTLLGIEF
jgi:hypothetical protein